ncbi:MAG: hypothetical protein QM739_00715 [Propionivibrio sp.]
MRDDQENMGLDDVHQETESGNAVGSPFARTRRKFVLSATAAPVLLAVSGRSALACQTVPKGLSFAAWCSVNPKKGTTAGTCVSHTVSGSGHTPCRPPSDWTPRKTGSCFPVAWPNNSQCVPFQKCKQRYTDNYGRVKYRDKSWGGPSGTYKDMCHHYEETSYNDAGWNSGTKLSWLDGNKSISRILIDELLYKNTGNKAEFCAAWLNAHAYPLNYPLKPDQVRELYVKGCIGNQGYVLSADQCKAFLQQLHT